MKDIRERFEKEFGTRSDYFNHRLGLFMEMEDWIERECRKAAIEAIEKCAEVARAEEISALEKDRDEFAIGKEMKWISVKDKLPPLYKKVLVYLSTGAIKVDERFKSLHGKQVGDWRHTYPDYNLTHWMPLPEPPQERSPVIGTGIPEGGKDYE